MASTSGRKKRTILLYGRTRSGKSTQIGELAEHIFLTEGKRTRVYTADRGGVGPIQPYVDLGIIEVVDQKDSPIWIFLNNAAKGKIRDEKGNWVETDNSGVGLFAFESMTAFADAMMASLADQSATGTAVGGSSNISFTVKGDNTEVKIGGANMAHYGVVQTRITNEVWASQRLPGDVLWTASVSKDDDQVSVGKVLGPAVVGKALTAEVPRWFEYTFRIDAIPAQAGKKESHVLYLGNSMDSAAGNAVSLGNTRIPKDSPELPTIIDPASLVVALNKIEGGYSTAVDAIRKRIGTKSVNPSNTSVTASI